MHTPNNVREFKQIHGNQYKLIHLRLEAKMATSFRERIGLLRAMFVNSNILQTWSRPRVKRQGVFALTVMANIQRPPHSRPCSLYTSHLQFFQWSYYISFLAPPPPSDSLPSLVVESMLLFHRNTRDQLGDIGESSDPHIKGALYRIQILCRRYTFWSYPAVLTIADPPG